MSDQRNIINDKSTVFQRCKAWKEKKILEVFALNIEGASVVDYFILNIQISKSLSIKCDTLEGH